MMSRQYYSRRTYNAGTDINSVVFIFTIILFWDLWTDNLLLLKIEHWSDYILIGVVSLVCSRTLYRLLRRIQAWKLNQSTSMARIDIMTGLDFEFYVANLLKKQGYKNIKMTEKYDLGVDIVAVRDGVTWGIQIKRYSGLVKADAVRQVVTALRKYHCDRAMLVTNSHFSSVARDLALSNDCVLIDRQKLHNWL